MAEQNGQNNSWRSLAQYWQVPVFVLSVVLLLLGWMLALPEGESVDPVKELGQARELLGAGRQAEADKRLDVVAGHFAELSDEQKGRYHRLRGDLAWRRSRAVEETNRARRAAEVIEHYDRAEQHGASLAVDRLIVYVTSLVDLGRIDAALDRLARLSDQDVSARHRLMRRVIEHLSVDPSRDDEAGKLLRQFLDEDHLARDHQVWAVGRIAERRIVDGKADEASKMLLVWYGRLQLDGRDDLGPLMVLLGRAYMALGEMPPAEQWFLRVPEHVEPSDPLNAGALVGLGRIRLAENNVVGALEHFDEAASRFPTTRWHLRALIGKAECEARMGALSESLDDYGEAVRLIRASTDPEATADRALLAESLAGQREWRYAQGDYQFALELLELEEGMYGDDPPADLLLRLAATHERIARQSLGLDEGEFSDADTRRKLDPMQRGKASVHFESAGDYYLAHAEAVTVTDNDAYGESLWRAGAAYDEAGLHDRAVELLARFLVDRPDDDPHRLQVLYRLGRAYQAQGRFDLAIGKFEALVSQHAKSPEAYDSLVPLAQCYLAKGAAYWPKAEHLLTTVVDDHEALRPESGEYREALIELGRLYYRRGDEGDYDRAIARLDEAAKRYGDQPEAAELLFQLADAYRKSVDQIDRELAKAPPPSRKVELHAERARRLDEARQRFDQVVRRLEGVGPAKLGDLSKLYLRNAYFYRADCAYDLGQFEGPNGAIALYQKAVQRYEKDPAVLVAWIQIVNCWCELGRFDQARSANNQAKWYLKRIPDQAFADPALPMSREHWQRWLDWTSQLDLESPTAAVAP